MKVDKTEVARIFREMVDFLAIKGENPFRIRAYEKAADLIEHLSPEENVLFPDSSPRKRNEVPWERFLKVGTIYCCRRGKVAIRLKLIIPILKREITVSLGSASSSDTMLNSSMAWTILS